jgi:hypothetical protein
LEVVVDIDVDVAAGAVSFPGVSVPFFPAALVAFALALLLLLVRFPSGVRPGLSIFVALLLLAVSGGEDAGRVSS